MKYPSAKFPVLLSCKKCGAANDEARRRVCTTGPVPVYRCGYCGVFFNFQRWWSPECSVEKTQKSC